MAASIFLTALFSGYGVTADKISPVVGEVRVEAWGTHSCRVRAAAPGCSVVEQSTPSALLPQPSSPSPRPSRSTADGRGHVVVVNGNIECTLSADGTLLVTRRSDDAVLVRDGAMAFGAPPMYPHDDGFLQASMTYTSGGSGDCEDEERLYGFGETRTGVVDQLAARVHPSDDDDDATLHHPHPPSAPTRSFFQNFSLLATYGHSIGGQWSIPVCHSSRGYSFLWNSPSFGSVNATSQARTKAEAEAGAPALTPGSMTTVRWFSDATRQIDFVVSTVSATAKVSAPFPELLERYADMTGHAPPMPAFASGFWQSRNRYRNQTQLLDIAAGYKARGLPLSAIVIDYFHWSVLGDWAFNSQCWPDPSAMTRALAAENVTVMASVWPMSTRNSTHYPELLKNGMLSLYEDGTPQPMDTWCDGHVYDPFSAATRARLFSYLKEGYVQHGITTFWLDADEPEHILSTDNGRWKYSSGWDSAVGMAFPLLHQQMVMEGLASAGIPASERIALSRSAWAGSQRHGVITWSGDIHSTFDELALQVRTAQGVAMSGISLWTTDIGGYQGGDLGNPEFEELVVRWMQFGVFCPITRLHGIRGGCNATTDDECGTDNCANELWAFEQYNILKDLVLLRESIRPYVEDGLRGAQESGLPLLRPMFLEFPGDKVCAGAGVDDQYMFGSKYLVSPVTVFGAISKTVYLPSLAAGEEWVYYFNHSRFSGGQHVAVETPLYEFPLFTREQTGVLL